MGSASATYIYVIILWHHKQDTTGLYFPDEASTTAVKYLHTSVFDSVLLYVGAIIQKFADITVSVTKLCVPLLTLLLELGTEAII